VRVRRTPSIRGFPGTSNWEETQRKTQDTLQGFYPPADLGTSRGPQNELEHVRVKGKPGPTPERRMVMDGCE